MDDSPLVLHLDEMPCAVYARLLTAMADGDNETVLDILDGYAEGGLKGRHWLYFELAIAQARQTFVAGVKAAQEAQAAAEAANTAGAAWMGMVSRPKATWER